jgi:hypothetical protein
MSLKLNAWIEADTLPLGMAALHAIKAEVDAENEAHWNLTEAQNTELEALTARIAELTAERDLMRASLNLCLSSAASWEERASLHRKQSDDYSAGIYQSLEGCAEEIHDIARNALKDGV